MLREDYIVLITKTAATLLAGKEEVLNPNYGEQDKQIEWAVEVAAQIIHKTTLQANAEFTVEGSDAVLIEKSL